MKFVTEYKVVRGKDDCEQSFVRFESEVTRLLKEGWKTCGGISIYNYDRVTMAQAMTLERVVDDEWERDGL